MGDWVWDRSTHISQDENQGIRTKRPRDACHLAGVSSESLSCGSECYFHKGV